MLTKWALAVLATKADGHNVINGVSAYCIEASSLIEAEGYGMRICRKRFPGCDGWGNHVAGATSAESVVTLDDVKPAELTS